MSLAIALATTLAPRAQPSDPWASWRWLASVDLRVLGAILAAAALLAVWGVWVGWRTP